MQWRSELKSAKQTFQLVVRRNSGGKIWWHGTEYERVPITSAAHLCAVANFCTSSVGIFSGDVDCDPTFITLSLLFEDNASQELVEETASEEADNAKRNIRGRK